MIDSSGAAASRNWRHMQLSHCFHRHPHGFRMPTSRVARAPSPRAPPSTPSPASRPAPTCLGQCHGAPANACTAGAGATLAARVAAPAVPAAHPDGVVQLEVDELQQRVVELQEGQHHAVVHVRGQHLGRDRKRGREGLSHSHTANMTPPPGHTTNAYTGPPVRPGYPTCDSGCGTSNPPS